MAEENEVVVEETPQEPPATETPEPAEEPAPAPVPRDASNPSQSDEGVRPEAKTNPSRRKRSRLRRSQHQLPSPRTLRRLQRLQPIPSLPLSPRRLPRQWSL